MECHKPKNCLREVSPGCGEFFGTPFVYDENWFGCFLCKREEQHQKELVEYEEKGEEDDCSRESVKSEV